MAITIDGSANTIEGITALPDLAEGGLADAKIINADIKDDTISEAKLDIHADPSGTDKYLAYTSNGMEWATVAGGVDGISSSADATAITIDSSEHVIVGGTTVSGVHAGNQDFVVGNTSNTQTGMALNCASGGYISIVMSDGQGDKNKGLIAYNHADDTMKICNDPASGSDGLVLESDNDVKIATGNLVIGTSGKGIDFSATSDASGSSSELLDDYEEGSWTVTSPGGAVAPNSPVGVYTKIGNLVCVQCYFGSASSGNMAVNDPIEIEGLPFSRASTVIPPAFIQINYDSSNGSIIRGCTVNTTPAITGRIGVTTGHARSGPGYQVIATYRVA